MGAALLLECDNVLAKDELLAKVRLNGVGRQLLFNAFVSKCDWCAIYFKWRQSRGRSVDEALELLRR